VNEPDGDPAPRFFLGRTREGNLWRCRYDLPVDIIKQLEQLAASEPVSDDLRADPINLQAFKDVLRPHGEVRDVSGGPAYYYPEDIPQPANTVEITEDNVELLRNLEVDLDNVPRALTVRSPWIVVVDNGIGVASCFSARLTSRAAEAGLWAHEAYYRRGFGSAAAAAWAIAVRKMGRIPLYSTGWDNLASQGVARRLGLRMYASDLSLD
jgi:hypothetical protein